MVHAVSILRKTAFVAIGAMALVSGCASQTPGAGGNAPLAAPTLQVRPDVQAYLDRLITHPRPVRSREMVLATRKMVIPAAMMGDFAPGDLGVVCDVTMPGPGVPFQLKLFDPRKDRGPGPVMVFYHGGGFVVGSISTHSGLAAEMARALDLPVISVGYRLAPEHPWPAGPDDAEAAARWIAQNGSAFGRSFTSMALSGDSAGGNLTLIAALALRDKPATLPVVFQLPLYPVTDSSRTYPSRGLFNHGFGLEQSSMDMFQESYAADLKNWRASPMLASAKGLPPTLLVTAELDPLRDEGRAYFSKLRKAGVVTSHFEAKGQIHGFATFRKAIPSAATDLDEILGQARIMLAKALAAQR